MRLYVSIRGEWADVFDVWVFKGDLLYVWLDELPLAVEEDRVVTLTYVGLYGGVDRVPGRIESVDLHRGEFSVGIRPEFQVGGESA